MAIEKKQTYPQSVVDAVAEQQITDNRVTGFDVTVERVIGRVELSGNGKRPPLAVAMELIGAALDQSPAADMPVAFRFTYLSEAFRVTVDVED